MSHDLAYKEINRQTRDYNFINIEYIYINENVLSSAQDPFNFDADPDLDPGH